ncbi:retrotransposon ORF1 [Tanacetum coccineum]
MGKGSLNKRKQLENYKLTYSDMGPSMSTGKPLTQEEAEREALAINKMKLNGVDKKEEEVMIKIKREALLKKDDPGAFVILIRLEGNINLNALVDIGSNINTMPYRIYKELGREDVHNLKKGITMLNHSKAEPMRLLRDVLCQVGVTTIIAKFLIMDMPIDRDTPILVGRGFLYTCGGILNTIDRITSTFDRICHQTFHAAQISLDTAESDSDDEKEYAIQRNKFGAPIYRPKPARLWEQTMMRPDHQDPNALDNTKPRRMYYFHKFIMNSCNGKVAAEMQSLEINGMLRINLCEAGTNEEIFTSVAWIRAFNINEPIYSELCHEFYSTYEFDEVCTDDELKTKKIIKFRLGGHAHRSLRSDEHFYAQEYWLSISLEENLSLYRSYAVTIRNRTPKRVCECGVVDCEAGEEKRSWYSERESMICCGQFITKIDRKARVLSDEVIRSLSALIYCRDLDTITLRELIDSEGRLILEDPQSGVPRVVIPRPPRTSMQDLYERMGSMEIRQGAIERVAYRQSYHWDRYDGLLDYLSTWLGFTVFHCR